MLHIDSFKESLMVKNVGVERENLFTVEFVFEVVGTGGAIGEDRNLVSLLVRGATRGIDTERSFHTRQGDGGYPTVLE